MMTNYTQLTDDTLHEETRRAAESERLATSELLRLLIEVERRGLHLALGHSSLFAYCVKSLMLSEQAAYSRITAARAARRYPQLLPLLADGALTLSSVGLLAPHLSEETADVLIDAAKFRSTRDVERLIASAFPQPDIPSLIAAVPASAGSPGLPAPPGDTVESAASIPRFRPTPRRAVIAPIAPSRYLLRVTVSAETEAKLQRARALLRHAVPDGDIDKILNRALTLLLTEVERAKAGRSRRPRPPASTPSRSRRIPAAVRRAVWERDGGRCAYRGAEGACGETGFLEFHHVLPYATGGSTTVENLQLRCRAHNQYEASVHFGQNSAPVATRRAPS